jgi:hypothetical protein
MLPVFLTSNLSPRTLVRCGSPEADACDDGVDDSVGDSMGDGVGDPVGDDVGESVGDVVGNIVGDGVGNGVGNPVGEYVGDDVGEYVGDSVGEDVGEPVGDAVGNIVGDGVGNGVGNPVGDDVGDAVGDAVGDITALKSLRLSKVTNPHAEELASAILRYAFLPANEPSDQVLDVIWWFVLESVFRSTAPVPKSTTMIIFPAPPLKSYASTVLDAIIKACVLSSYTH